MKFNIDNKYKKCSGIYCIVNIVNGKCYIGSTINFSKRYYAHFSNLLANKHVNKILLHSFNKYGKDAFEFNLLELVLDKEDLIKREQSWIDLVHPVFNIRVAGEYRVNDKKPHKNSDKYCSTDCLTKKQIDEVIRMLNKGVSTNKIIKKFNVSYRCIHAIEIGKSFKYIPRNPSLKHKHEKGVLTPRKVMDIIHRINWGEDVVDIAKDYNVSKSCIVSIKNKKTWKEYSELFLDN